MKISKLVVTLTTAVFCIAILTAVAFSEEIKAKIKSVDASTNTVVVTTNNTDMPIVVEDKATSEQLKAGKIKVGTKVKIEYQKKGGKNVASSFKKLPGC